MVREVNHLNRNRLIFLLEQDDLIACFSVDHGQQIYADLVRAGLSWAVLVDLGIKPRSLVPADMSGDSRLHPA